MKHMSKVVFIGLFFWTATTAAAGVLFQDNFDGYTDSMANHGWGYVGSQVSTPSNEGRNGSRAAKVTYIGTGTAPYAIVKDLGSLNLQEVYIRFSFKVDNPSGGNKFLKFFGKQNSPQGYANSTFMLNYSGGDLFEISYGAGNTENDTQNTIRYSPEKNFAGGGFDPLVNLEVAKGSFNPKDGNWHTYEVFMRYNSNGKRDGAYTIWIDGILWVKATNVVNRNDANSLYFNNVNLGDYCSSLWSHVWNIWYDDVVISTEHIGLVGETPVPTSPPATSTPVPSTSTPKAVQGFKAE